VPQSGGYQLTSGNGTFHALSGSAIPLSLGFGTEAAIGLAAPFPLPGGFTNTLAVSGQGIVSVALGNATVASPSRAGMLNAPQTAWWSWHDFAPSPTNGVWLDRSGTNTLITWNAVRDASGTGSSTWQMQFDSSNGVVRFVWQNMSTGGGRYVVGYSPGGPSLDPGNRDLSATPSGTFTTPAADHAALALRATRPALGSTCTLLVASIPPGSPFGGLLFGGVRHDPGIDLGAIGMPGCFRYNEGSATVLFVTTGGEQSFALPIPAGLPPGLQAYVQAATFSPPMTPLGFVSSNGIALTVGV
jgi:hypothetical protein